MAFPAILRYTDGSSKLLAVIIYSLVLGRFCHGSLRVKPSNIEAVVGQRVQFNCSTSEPHYVLWDYAAVGSTSRDYIFYSGVLILPYSRRFQLDRDTATGVYNIVIPSVRKEDAGNYRCMDMVGHGEQAEAELIVLDSNPRCETDVIKFCEQTSQDFETSCTVRFRGNLVPEMECSSNGVMAFNSMVKEQAQDNVTYNLRLTAHWPIDDGHPIVCHTSISHVSSFVNPPVSYAFGSNESQTINHRATINCSAKSNEQCVYQWINKNTSFVISSSQALRTDEEGQYICEATCFLRNQMCVVTPLVANLETQDSLFQTGGDGVGSHLLPVVVTVAVIAVLCLLVGVLVISMVYLRKRSARKANKDCETRKSSVPKRSITLLKGNSHNADDKSLEHNQKLNDNLHVKRMCSLNDDFSFIISDKCTTCS